MSRSVNIAVVAFTAPVVGVMAAAPMNQNPQFQIQPTDPSLGGKFMV